MLVVFKRLYKLQRGFVYIFALGKNALVVKPYNVALFQLEAVHGRISYRVGNLTGGNVIYCVGHIRLVFGHGRVRIKLQRRRKALRYVFGGNNVYSAVSHKRLGLLCRKYYVAVVGEYENVACVYLLNGVRNILRRRVHGLTALYYSVAKQVLENFFKSAARADCKHAHFLLFRL